jgi:hypothetical protein
MESWSLKPMTALNLQIGTTVIVKVNVYVMNKEMMMSIDSTILQITGDLNVVILNKPQVN